MKNIELLNEVCEEAVLDTLETIANLQEIAKVVMESLLEDEGATLGEKVFASNIIENYVEVLNNIIDQEFDIMTETEILEWECNGNCENCN